jgi:tetratricopeptide (TPR) repeat protein
VPHNNRKISAAQGIGRLSLLVFILFSYWCQPAASGQEALPVSSERQIAAGVQALQSGNLDEASTIFERVLRNGIKHPLVLHNLGVIAQQRGNHSLAIQRFRETLALQPGYGPSRLLLGSSLLALGKNAEAVRELKRAANLMPREPLARLQLAKAFEASENWLDAVDQLKQLVQLSPEEPEYSYQLGKALSKLSGWALLEISRQNPNAARLQQALAQDYVIQGKYEDALRAYQNASRSDPQLAEIHLGMAVALLELKKLDEAMAEINLELKLVPYSKAAAEIKTKIETARAAVASPAP